MSNITSSLVWNGVELTAIGGTGSSVVVRKNIEVRPAKRATKLIIPGRNGAEYVDEGYFDNVPASYTLIFTDFPKYDAVVNYLLSVKGFAKLEDQYDPDIYRMARVSSVDPRTPDRQIGYVTVNFECKPERFLKATTSITASTGLSAKVTNDETLCRMLKTGENGGTYTFTYDGANWYVPDMPTFADGYIKADGTWNGYNYYQTTDYIWVADGQKFRYKLSSGTGGQLPVISKYDLQKVFDSDETVTWNNVGYAEGIYTVNGDGYIRVTYFKTRSDIYWNTAVDLADYGIELTGTPASGNTIAVTITNPSVVFIKDTNYHYLTNPTYKDAKPWIKVYRKSTIIKGTVDIGIQGRTPFSMYSFEVDTDSLNRPYVIVDSDKEDCFMPDGSSANEYIEFVSPFYNYSFPIFQALATTRISIGNLGGVDEIGQLEIMPRWWKL